MTASSPAPPQPTASASTSSPVPAITALFITNLPAHKPDARARDPSLARRACGVLSGRLLLRGLDGGRHGALAARDALVGPEGVDLVALQLGPLLARRVHDDTAL